MKCEWGSIYDTVHGVERHERGNTEKSEEKRTDSDKSPENNFIVTNETNMSETACCHEMGDEHTHILRGGGGGVNTVTDINAYG